MTLVVADTGPIRYLVLIEAIGVLPKLFNRVILPGAVVAELTHPRAPLPIRNWAAKLPSWAERRDPVRLEFETHLDRGEAEAIALAIELGASALLLDETEAREAAKRRALPVTGTVGILEKAAAQNLLSLPDALERLQRTNFRIDARIIREALERTGRQS